MKRVFASLLLLLTVLQADAYRKPRFKPFEIKDLEPKPAFWQVRPSEVIAACKAVRNGRVEVIAKTPLGYPVYAVFFGDFSEPAPQTNWSAGNSSTTRDAYLGEAPRDRQTILFLAGVHGSEPENVAAAVNMISLLDTGRDLLGREDPEFLALARRYRIIIVPCANMDGRLISPDHFRHQPYEVFRAASQGTWKDGSLIGWQGSKMWFPLPLDKVQHPGGYPNSEGYNLQHDVAPGDIRTAEARAICRLMARWRVDFQLNGHSCQYPPYLIYPSQVETEAHRKRADELCRKVNQAFYDTGLNPGRKGNTKHSTTINLTNLTHWCSGGLGITLENYHGCYTAKGEIWEYSFEQLMAPAFVALKVIMADGLEKPLAVR
ncbi:MAG: hypothetical protein IJV01_04545 [Bacteroidales bacterium]|nr:hypothetical protein [Bacteroidales bacterium]